MKRFLFLLVLTALFNLKAGVSVTGSNPDLIAYYSFDNLSTSAQSNITNYAILTDPDQQARFRYYYTHVLSSAPCLYSNITAPYCTQNSSIPVDGAAIYLDGRHYIDMMSNEPLSTLYTGAITISFWVKFSGLHPMGADCFIAKNRDNGGNAFLFGVWDSTLVVHLDNNQRKVTNIDDPNGIDVYDGDWHHFVLVVEDDANDSGHSDVTIWIDNNKVWNKADIPDQLEYSDVFSATYMPSIGMETIKNSPVWHKTGERFWRIL